MTTFQIILFQTPWSIHKQKNVPSHFLILFFFPFWCYCFILFWFCFGTISFTFFVWFSSIVLYCSVLLLNSDIIVIHGSGHQDIHIVNRILRRSEIYCMAGLLRRTDCAELSENPLAHWSCSQCFFYCHIVVARQFTMLVHTKIYATSVLLFNVKYTKVLSMQ